MIPGNWIAKALGLSNPDTVTPQDEA